LPESRKPYKARELRSPKVAADLALAETFQGLLDAGEVRNRADLARHFGLTRARVTQLVNLLRLHPDILAYVRSLPRGTPTKLVTERGLRALVQVPRKRQVSDAKLLVPGFADFIRTASEHAA
jgi:hypothetical protein